MSDIKRDVDISRILVNMATEKRIPITAGFELTPRCTMRCKMCYIVSDKADLDIKKELTAEQWIDIAKQGMKLGLLYVQLTGGEAMMRKDFKEIYSAMHLMGLKISINTNATLFDDDMISFFKQYPPVKFSVSLYGASNETYDSLCGFKNGYDIVTKNIDRLIKEGFNVKINLTVTRYNEADAVDICRFAVSRNLPINVMTYTLPPESSSDYTVDDTRLDSDGAVKTYLKCVSEILGEGRFKNKIASLSALSIPCEADLMCDFPDGADKLRCQAGTSSYWITWDGKMHPCVNLSPITAYPLVTGLKAAWESILEETERRVRFPKRCVNCPTRKACFACPGYFYGETGELDGFSQDVCEYTEKYILYSRKINEGKDINEI